jgi:hypothetical protein
MSGAFGNHQVHVGEDGSVLEGFMDILQLEHDGTVDVTYDAG